MKKSSINIQSEIILYQTQDNQTALEVKFESETIWLTQVQIVILFATSKANVSEHIKQIYQSKELEVQSTVRKFRTVQIEGKRNVSRNVDHYNLDMIISIGYRVNSIRGTQFRIWANKVLKNYLLNGYVINQRIEKLENKVYSLEQKSSEFDFHIKTSLPPHEGIFFDGQIFDAYEKVSSFIKDAKSSIILIDNYIDETVLTLLSKRKKGVKTTIFTQNISKQLALDIQKHNAQYESIEVKIFNKSHDRFLIIDEKTIYHVGASLKDLGKRWFAFSKIDINPELIIKELKTNNGNV
ncbi:MAG: DNA-binding protein [Bacteroidetes bacterium GWA2_31_9]|nr:MAG: DNA-binding protein [Bacteroidetes bacterium GWA2_31_9]